MDFFAARIFEVRTGQIADSMQSATVKRYKESEDRLVIVGGARRQRALGSRRCVHRQKKTIGPQ